VRVCRAAELSVDGEAEVVGSGFVGGGTNGAGGCRRRPVRNAAAARWTQERLWRRREVWRRSQTAWRRLILDCQRTSVEGRSRGGRAAGDSAPGGSEDETPSWRSASGGAECSNKTEEQHTQERHRRPEIRLISSVTSSISDYHRCRVHYITDGITKFKHTHTLTELPGRGWMPNCSSHSSSSRIRGQP